MGETTFMSTAKNKKEQLLKAALLLQKNCQKSKKDGECDCFFLHYGCCILEPLPDRQKLEKVSV